MIPKTEAINRVTEQQRAEMERFETLLDKAIEQKFSGEQFGFTVVGLPCEKVQSKLIEKYRDGGWNLQFRSSQTDGCWIEVS